VSASIRERILIVENDPEISDLVGRQALQSTGYQTFVVSDANTALSKTLQLAPDAILIDLNLPGLSGKDLMVALTSQGIQTPIIVLSLKGTEADIIQAFRLGATDYLLWPVREAEVINVVERVLKQVRERHERERLAQQLQQTNQELQLRVRELTAIFAIGKAVVSITDQSVLFEKILDGATRVTQADLGWFLLREEKNRVYTLAAHRNLPGSMAERMNLPWDDGVSSLVAMSGESLSIHGEPLKRFKIFTLGQSALIVPIKVQKQVVGMLVVMRRQPQPFNPSDQHLLEAVADYAAISLANAHLFRAIEERARKYQALVESAQANEKIANELVQGVKKELRFTLDQTRISLDRLTKSPAARWASDQRQELAAFQDQVQQLNRIIETITPIQTGNSSHQSNVNELVRQTFSRYQTIVQSNDMSINMDIPSSAVIAKAEPGQVSQILDGLISASIQNAKPGGQINFRLETTPDLMAHITITNSRMEINRDNLAHLFDADFHLETGQNHRFGGLGISLCLIKELVILQKGKIWAESKDGAGTSFHIALPIFK
jgi:DNA-binding response OmpR family regulator/signal transduction histidine kinase